MDLFKMDYGENKIAEELASAMGDVQEAYKQLSAHNEYKPDGGRLYALHAMNSEGARLMQEQANHSTEGKAGSSTQHTED